MIHDMFSQENYTDGFKSFVSLMMEQRDELKLLLMHADGSKFSNFREELGMRYQRSAEKYFETLRRLNPDFKKTVSLSLPPHLWTALHQFY